MEYATIDAFRRDPAKVWDFYSKRVDILVTARPNAGHVALADLERRGLVEAVITQNVDALHQAAGSRRVLEVHGSIRSAICLDCGHREGFDRVLELLPVPTCTDCGGVLKPDVVMFGEELPAGAMDQASWLAQNARLLLVVGSSLEVYPVAGLPEDGLQAGARLAIVNRGPTPYDRRADLKIDGAAGEVLAATLAELDAPTRSEL
jgi:NAD-dependent deacetylase